MMAFVGAGKIGVLYFLVQPHLDTTMFFGPHTLMMLVGVYPFLYALLMLRCQISLFKSIFPKPTIEAVLYQNMMWHVLMDFIDIAQMFPYNSKDFQELELQESSYHHAYASSQFYCENSLEQVVIAQSGGVIRIVFVELRQYFSFDFWRFVPCNSNFRKTIWWKVVCRPIMSPEISCAIGLFCVFGLGFHALSFPGIGLRPESMETQEGGKPRRFVAGMHPRKRATTIDKIDLTTLRNQTTRESCMARTNTQETLAAFGAGRRHSLESLSSVGTDKHSSKMFSRKGNSSLEVERRHSLDSADSSVANPRLTETSIANHLDKFKSGDNSTKSAKSGKYCHHVGTFAKSQIFRWQVT